MASANEAAMEEAAMDESWITVSDDDLDEDEIRPVTAAGREMIIYRSGGRVYAAERYCLHAGADLSEGIVDGAELVCALHGWSYRVDTGIHVQSPMNCLTVFRVRVAAGRIQVDPRPVRHVID
jgi:nitrite reductase/ring-hydroxylating ferredoxin subunit